VERTKVVSLEPAMGTAAAALRVPELFHPVEMPEVRGALSTRAEPLLTMGLSEPSWLLSENSPTTSWKLTGTTLTRATAAGRRLLA
jgi:hypothetical protein